MTEVNKSSQVVWDEELAEIIDESKTVSSSYCRVLVNGIYPEGTIVEIVSYEAQGVNVTQDGEVIKYISTDDAQPEECAYILYKSYGSAQRGDVVVLFEDSTTSKEESYFDVYTLKGELLGKIK